MDHHKLHAQQEAASAAAAAAAEATREAGERRRRADEEVVAVRTMEEQSRAWLQHKEAELAAKLEAATSASEAAEQRARAADAALQEREAALSGSMQQLQAREDALVRPCRSSPPHQALPQYANSEDGLLQAIISGAYQPDPQAKVIVVDDVAQAADRRAIQKERAQLDAEREMLQVQQEDCASQIQKVSCVCPWRSCQTCCYDISSHLMTVSSMYVPAQLDGSPQSSESACLLEVCCVHAEQCPGRSS